jgi:hypothetical protein
MSPEYSIISFRQPGAVAVPIGVLLLDRDNSQLRVLFRRDWDTFAGPTDAKILEALSAELIEMANTVGATRFIELLEGSLSHSIQITNRKGIDASDVDSALERLFERYVERATT